jgi:NADH:ubiquinone oxidoreductase subunit 5 (subunit L)/multisubunit Na+/H+ antiporter MnhA subunit
VLSSWNYSPLLAIIAASGVILTAGYILWTIQRVYLGPEYKGPHEDHLTPSNLRENVIGTVLAIFAVLFGIFPYQTVLKYMDATINRQVRDLAVWTQTEKERPAAANVGGLAEPRAASLSAHDAELGTAYSVLSTKYSVPSTKYVMATPSNRRQPQVTHSPLTPHHSPVPPGRPEPLP